MKKGKIVMLHNNTPFIESNLWKDQINGNTKELTGLVEPIPIQYKLLTRRIEKQHHVEMLPAVLDGYIKEQMYSVRNDLMRNINQYGINVYVSDSGSLKETIDFGIKRYTISYQVKEDDIYKVIIAEELGINDKSLDEMGKHAMSKVMEVINKY